MKFLQALSNKRTRRKFLPLVVVLLIIGLNHFFPDSQTSSSGGEPTDIAVLMDAYEQRQSKVWVQGLDFKVVKRLADDNEGSRHQRFIVRHHALPKTLLVSHNIDLAEPVPLLEGDNVTIAGRYEWTEKGGVLHWTHHDPRGKIDGGWIEHQGRRYQ